jgi:hypothetical protein
VLAVEIARAGFEWALAHACLSHFDSDRYASHEAWARQVKASPVRVQWDPERSLGLELLPYRSLQVGLSGSAVSLYVDEWIVNISDVTDTAHRIRDLLRVGDEKGATALLPDEQPYPLPEAVAATIAATRS